MQYIFLFIAGQTDVAASKVKFHGASEANGAQGIDLGDQSGPQTLMIHFHISLNVIATSLQQQKPQVGHVVESGCNYIDGHFSSLKHVTEGCTVG